MLIPAASRDDIADTVDSVLHFEPDALVVVINDTWSDLQLGSRVLSLPALPWPRNALGGLLCKELYALEFLLQWESIEIVLRLDADALILRTGGFTRAGQSFDDDSSVGAAGGFRLTADGGERDFTPAAQAIRRKGGWRALHRRRGRHILDSLQARAFENGYESGAHALGAAVYLRRAMLERWRDLGFFRLWALAKMPIADDFLLGLLCYASGFRLTDIGGPKGSIAVAWRGLPMSPELLLERRVFLTHSVRSWEGLDERAIRDFFRRLRQANADPSTPPQPAGNRDCCTDW